MNRTFVAVGLGAALCAFTFAAVVAVGLLGCASTAKKKALVSPSPEKRAVARKEPRRAAAGEATAAPAKAAPSPRTYGPIYFGFDSAALSDEARDTLSQVAEYLSAAERVRITIAGHCDERGTTEYNLALGEVRARAARDYLRRLGVAPERLAVVSFGEEMPAAAGSGEEVWARNRRGEFEFK